MPLVSLLATMAIPLDPPSTSVMAPVNALTSEPTAPDGAPASSSTVIDRAEFASTGASFTAVTTASTTSVAVEKAVVPPVLDVLTLVAGVPPSDWSQARMVSALVEVPL